MFHIAFVQLETPQGRDGKNGHNGGQTKVEWYCIGTHATTELRKLRQEDYQFEASWLHSEF